MTIQILSFPSAFPRCYLLCCKWNLKNWLFIWKLYISFCDFACIPVSQKKNNLPWSNQVFHEIFQLTVWVPLQWLEEDSKERRHEDQPLKKSNDCHEKLAISRKWGDKSCAGEKFYWLATGASRYICVYIFVPHKLRGRLVSSTRCTQVQHV